MLLRWWNWSVFWDCNRVTESFNETHHFPDKAVGEATTSVQLGWTFMGVIVRYPMDDMGFHDPNDCFTRFCLWLWTFVDELFENWGCRKEPWASSHLNLKFGFKKTQELVELKPCLYFGRCLVGSAPVCCCHPLKLLRSFILSSVWQKTASHKCWMSGSLSPLVSTEMQKLTQ